VAPARPEDAQEQRADAERAEHAGEGVEATLLAASSIVAALRGRGLVGVAGVEGVHQRPHSDASEHQCERRSGPEERWGEAARGRRRRRGHARIGRDGRRLHGRRLGGRCFEVSRGVLPGARHDDALVHAPTGEVRAQAVLPRSQKELVPRRRHRLLDGSVEQQHAGRAAGHAQVTELSLMRVEGLLRELSRLDLTRIARQRAQGEGRGARRILGGDVVADRAAQSSLRLGGAEGELEELRGASVVAPQLRLLCLLKRSGRGGHVTLLSDRRGRRDDAQPRKDDPHRHAHSTEHVHYPCLRHPCPGETPGQCSVDLDQPPAPEDELFQPCDACIPGAEAIRVRSER